MHRKYSPNQNVDFDSFYQNTVLNYQLFSKHPMDIERFRISLTAIPDYLTDNLTVLFLDKKKHLTNHQQPIRQFIFHIISTYLFLFNLNTEYKNILDSSFEDKEMKDYISEDILHYISNYKDSSLPKNIKFLSLKFISSLLHEDIINLINEQFEFRFESEARSIRNILKKRLEKFDFDYRQIENELKAEASTNLLFPPKKRQKFAPETPEINTSPQTKFPNQ